MNEPYITDLKIVAEILGMAHLKSWKEQVERLFRRTPGMALKRGRFWITTREMIHEGLKKQSRRAYA